MEEKIVRCSCGKITNHINDFGKEIKNPICGDCIDRLLEPMEPDGGDHY